jgi:hypothetical protein
MNKRYNRIAYKDTIHPKKISKVIFIQQFYIPSNKKRYQENLLALKFNVKCPNIDEIHLLNERIYTQEELGLSFDEFKHIKQINISHRLKYNDVFKYVSNIKWDGYVIFCNCDIFLTDIQNIFTSCLSYKKSMYCLLRYEYKKNIPLNECKLFVTRNKTFCNFAQDTWIFHAKYNIPEKELYKFNIKLGRTGCDNKVALLLASISYTLYNMPSNIRTYHVHESNIRGTNLRRLPLPYLFIMPF